METNINEIMIGGKNYEIKSVRMKYLKIGWYNAYLRLKEHGLLNILGYSDGERNLLVFLKGIFNMPEVDEGLLKGLYAELINNQSEKTIQKMLEITKRLNLIEE
ncbi:hypothetical protein [Clostridium sp. CF012]|uniref:hypothetical protein n=1 Tax=Clostridium sp. CF012 TaxID=2843319 RepID=UPI001C0BC147|nr:hypothetical protein [Clostridium sp. CF012]MBU3142227.1 hypothetical protein [Clostridium sp. CF012]